MKNSSSPKQKQNKKESENEEEYVGRLSACACYFTKCSYTQKKTEKND